MKKRIAFRASMITLLVSGAIGLVLTAPWQNDARTSSTTLASFYFEADVSTPGAPPGLPRRIIRSWYRAPNQTRWEFSCTGAPACENYTRVLIAAGPDSLIYEPDTNTYVRSHEDPITGKEGPYSLLGLTNFLPGPMVEEFAAHIRAGFPNLGHEEILGIEVTNYGDTWWIDDEHSFVLRQVGTVGDSSFVVEVTELEYNLELDAEVFDFEPPEGSREVQPSSSSHYSTYETPEGFLEAGYLPPGYEHASGFRAEGNHLWELTYKQNLTITQELRAGGPLIQPQGTPVALRNAQGVEFKSGSLNVVSWVEGDLKITISAPLPLEEIRRIAESMH